MYKSIENNDGNEHDRMRNEYKEGQKEYGQSEMPDKHFVHMVGVRVCVGWLV